ncbi:MAG: hypothetical protein VX949_06250 [Planctomycetota bacterium]|nr:hypothetical protein [Planctomycetota bacterium]
MRERHSSRSGAPVRAYRDGKPDEMTRSPPRGALCNIFRVVCVHPWPSSGRNPVG